IRLLKISSGIWGARCELVIETCDSNEMPRYEAISWRWDGPQPTHSLHLDASVFHITNNVFNILRELTPNYGTKYVWLDSICI
ncbi:hypothetical protein K469DRAFT_507029, partial [Zopfia rhizophila CBS 207.26]